MLTQMTRYFSFSTIIMWSLRLPGSLQLRVHRAIQPRPEQPQNLQLLQLLLLLQVFQLLLELDLLLLLVQKVAVLEMRGHLGRRLREIQLGQDLLLVVQKLDLDRVVAGVSCLLLGLLGVGGDDVLVEVVLEAPLVEVVLLVQEVDDGTRLAARDLDVVVQDAVLVLPEVVVVVHLPLAVDDELVVVAASSQFLWVYSVGWGLRACT